MICKPEPHHHRKPTAQATMLAILADHLDGLRRVLIETGRPAEAAAVKTEQAMLDAIRRLS